MATSQNGYSACVPSLIGKYTIPGSTVTINLRKGDVSVVLLDYAAWHHAHIEPLTQADTGGYNCRTISGSATTSNHGSGTAEDLRWNRHPRGKRNAGFSAAQVSKINAKLKEYAGVLRWGNNYSSASIPDAMHFEINAGPAAVKKQADRIRAKGKDDNVALTTTDADMLIDRLMVRGIGASGTPTVGVALQTGAYQNTRNLITMVTGIATAIASLDQVDEQALARAMAPAVAAIVQPALVAAIEANDGAPLSQAQTEQALRNVLLSGVGA